MNIILIAILFLLLVYISLDKYRDYKDRIQIANNSQVFHPTYANIWRNAAKDWSMNDEDERTFDEFFTDTVEIIGRIGQY